MSLRNSLFRHLVLVIPPFCTAGLAAPAPADDVIFGSFTWRDCGLRFYGCNDTPDDVAYVNTLAAHSDGKLYVAGEFQYVGPNIPSSCIAAWDGKAWQSLNSTPGGSVRSVLSVGESLYIGGYFTTLNGIPASRIARWDGKTWHPLGVGTNGAVLALAATNEKDQPVLYAAGTFGGAGGQSAKRIARWDGANWSNLGTGLDNTALGLTIFDDGKGPAVYVCGPFHKAGGLDAHKVAKWDIQTKTWSPLGGGVTSQEDATSLAIFDDGTGPALYMGGFFDQVDGQPIRGVAKWDGKHWSQVGPTGSPVLYVEHLKVRDDGHGPALYAIGGIIAKWDGQQWTRYEPLPGSLFDMEIYDSGNGPQLHVGGAGSQFDTKIARFERGFACGDFNRDGVVDQQDLGILLSSFDCAGPGCQGDADGDGDTDQADLGILLKFYGQECG